MGDKLIDIIFIWHLTLFLYFLYDCLTSYIYICLWRVWIVLYQDGDILNLGEVLFLHCSGNNNICLHNYWICLTIFFIFILIKNWYLLGRVFICLFVCLSICLSVYPSVSLSFCLSFYHPVMLDCGRTLYYH